MPTAAATAAGTRIKVLVVDDSAIVRKLLSETLAAEPDIEVVGTAPDPFVARDKIFRLKPDVLTLDVEMPRMDGLTFLRRLMHYQPLPVIVISSLAQGSAKVALDALSIGAVDVLAKPGGPYSVGDLKMSLAARVRAAAVARLKKPAGPPPPPDRMMTNPAANDAAPASQLGTLAAAVAQPAAAPPRAALNPYSVARPAPAPKPRFTGSPDDVVLAIGASTGGTEAIAQVLAKLPAHCPPIVITQHIPPVFSRAFADRLNHCCAMEVREAVDGDEVRPGLALVAPGNLHMLLRRSPAGLRVQVKNGPPVCYQRPSVDVLFHSVAEASGARAIGVLLTGMGSDGAQGLLKMRQAGARTFAQNESTCVVFGMPREAIKLGAAERIVGLPEMAGVLLGLMRT
jgi:two-component system chemotaxis response regulator CheB